MKTTKAKQATKADKAERRARRGSKRHTDHDSPWTARTLDGPIDPMVLRRTIDAFSSVDLGGRWPDLAPMVLPLLKRVRQPFPAEAAPIHLRVPPGVWAGFGIDVGPAWAHVSRDLLARWGVDEATVLGTALENLRQRAIDERPLVERATFGDANAVVVQAQGWGSALILAPERLAELIGPKPRTLLTPVRNALIALPEDVDVDLAVAVWGAFADGSADELDVDPLYWTGSSVVAALPDESLPTLVH